MTGKNKPENWDDMYTWDENETGKEDEVVLNRATKRDAGLPSEIKKMDRAQLVDRGAEIIPQIVGVTGLYRQLGEVVAALRIKHKDYAGRTAEYRADVAAMYRKAGVPTGLNQSVQQGIRHHVRRILWLEVTNKDLLNFANPFEPAPDRSRASNAPAPSGNGAAPTTPEEGTEAPEDEVPWIEVGAFGLQEQVKQAQDAFLGTLDREAYSYIHSALSLLDKALELDAPPQEQRSDAIQLLQGCIDRAGALMNKITEITELEDIEAQEEPVSENTEQAEVA